MFDPNIIIAWVVFGSIGTIYFGYGKWKDLWQPKVLGVALMCYPYVAPSGNAWTWGIGMVLTLAIFFARD